MSVFDKPRRQIDIGVRVNEPLANGNIVWSCRSTKPFDFRGTKSKRAIAQSAR